MIKISLNLVKEYRFLGLVLLMTAAFQAFNLTRFSFWHDESFSAILAQQSPADIVTLTALDVHPPLYYLLLHGWIGLFGAGEVAIRSLSVVAGLAVIVLSYLLIKRLGGSLAANWVVPVVAAGPFLLRYGLEARMYTVAAVLVLASTWCLLEYIQQHKRRLLIIYAVLVAAMLYTHYFTFTVPLVHVGLLMWQGRVNSISSLKLWCRERRDFLLSLATAVALFLPWLPVASRQLAQVAGGFWVAPESLLDPLNTLIFYQVNSDSFGLPLWLSICLTVSFLGLALITYRKLKALDNSNQTLLVAAVALSLAPLIVVLLISYLLPHSSVYVDRYFSYLSPFWYIWLGLLLYHIKNNFFKRAVAAIVVTTFIFGWFNLMTLGNYNWDRLAGHDNDRLVEHINTNYRPNQRIIVDDENLYNFFDIWYYNRTAAMVEVIDPGYRNGNAGLLRDQEARIITNYDAVRPVAIVWLVRADGLETALPDNWQPVSEKRRYAQASLQQFVVTPPGDSLLSSLRTNQVFLTLPADSL